MRIGLLLTLFAACVEAAQPREARLVPLGTMHSDVEVLYGDPEKAGEPFVMRIRELPGGIIPPHRHPVDEHITVVRGTLWFAVGDERMKFDRTAMQKLEAGSYAFIPKGATMMGWTPEAAVVQVHGVGPFHIHWRAGEQWREKDATLDDPGAGKIFTFRKGDVVIGERGRGRILQGYFSGEVLQYVVERADGSLYMATPEEIRRVAAKE